MKTCKFKDKQIFNGNEKVNDDGNVEEKERTTTAWKGEKSDYYE